LREDDRRVRHYWFTSWPDHHVPQCSAPLLRLVEEVEAYRGSLLLPGSRPITSSDVSAAGPVVVHCSLIICPGLSCTTLSAGIGRTGCFIVSSIGCQQLREAGQVDMLEKVCQLRLDRGGMKKTTEQYQFLYSTLAQNSSQLQHQKDQTPLEPVSIRLQELNL
ncbi:unnamed protein product, partial [Tetraodon nigroviridis]